MKLHVLPPLRCLLRQPAERGDVLRIPRYHPKVPAVGYQVWCPHCRACALLLAGAGVREDGDEAITEEVETSDGRERMVTHTAPLLTTAPKVCKACHTSWSTIRSAVTIHVAP